MQADQAIKNRKTQKVLADTPLDSTKTPEQLEATINALLELAAHAPYHKRCDEKYTKAGQKLNSCVPWRFYVLDTKNCRALVSHITEHGLKTGKIANMLAAADVLFLVTWLPDPPEIDDTIDNTQRSNTQEPIPFEGTIKNMEHIAAASAAIQNVLIGATARDIPNYWSSGGQLRNLELRNYLEIPMSEILLGAIFLFPPGLDDTSVTIKTGAMRNQGKDKTTWSTSIELVTK